MPSEAPFMLDTVMPVAKAVEDGEDGDLIIAGLAADFGIDRQNEAFAPGVFEKSIADFMAAGGPLCYHHKKSLQLGQVTELFPSDAGLLMKAVIPKPLGDSPLTDVYAKIKRGMMRGLSVSGRCKRAMTRQGAQIVGLDLEEISVTPVPVNPRTLMGVVAKAFPDDFTETGQGAEIVRNYFQMRFDELDEKLR